MNFRDDEFMLSVFLVLPREHGYADMWDEENQQFIFEGHDSTTVESGKSVDQLAMYESGKLTDNGKFLKAANAFKDGIRKEPMQIQVYEKIDSGVWFDKGIFDLIDARHVSQDGRKVYKFYLTPAETRGHYDEHDPDRIERLIPAGAKAEILEARQRPLRRLPQGGRPPFRRHHISLPQMRSTLWPRPTRDSSNFYVKFIVSSGFCVYLPNDRSHLCFC